MARVRRETASNFGLGLAITICRGDESEAGTYDDEGPREIDVPDMQMVAEEDKHRGDDDGGDELGESEEVESERWIVGRLLGEPVSCHCKSARKRVTGEIRVLHQQWYARECTPPPISDFRFVVEQNRDEEGGRRAVEGFASIAPGVEIDA